MPDNYKNVVFYHTQDKKHMGETGQLYLSWSGEGAKIIEIMQKNGLQTQWNGEESKRIIVQIPEKN